VRRDALRLQSPERIANRILLGRSGIGSGWQE
jgi:hypothetical protein